MSKCRYYQESSIEFYIPECSGQDAQIHPMDIEGERCPHCGSKIKFVTGKVPQHLLWEQADE